VIVAETTTTPYPVLQRRPSKNRHESRPAYESCQTEERDGNGEPWKAVRREAARGITQENLWAAYPGEDLRPEFIARSLRQWFAHLAIAPLFLEPGSPWENGYIESFNGKFRYNYLDGALFYTLREAQVLIERWRRHTIRSARTAHWGIGPRSGRQSLHSQCAHDYLGEWPNNWWEVT